MAGTRVEAWRVHDTGLVAVPSRFRRLGGLVRHLQGQGEPWPDQVALEVVDGELRVTGPDGAGRHVAARRGRGRRARAAGRRCTSCSRSPAAPTCWRRRPTRPPRRSSLRVS